MDAVRLLYLNVAKPGPFEQFPVVRTGERSCNTARPGFHVPAGRLVEVWIGDDIGHGEPAPRPEHPGRLGEGHDLVGRKVDDAVRNDDVDAGGRQGDVLDLALQELDIGQTGLLSVAPGERFDK